jgi:hypothetical protein
MFCGLSANPANYRRNYPVQVKQRDKEIPIKRKWTEAIISAGDIGPIDAGMYLTAEYSADDIDSETPATIEVLAPDGTNVVETFDLGSSELRMKRPAREMLGALLLAAADTVKSVLALLDSSGAGPAKKSTAPIV